MYPFLTSDTLVETIVVKAKISSYPELWQLYNETIGTYLAKPVDNRYLVCYNPCENTVSSGWKMLIK